MTTRRSILGAALAAPALRPAQAQSAWPQRPVRVVVAFAPGGPADIIGRLLAETLGEAWGRPVIVENRGGAGGNVAAQLMARANPDGYTALITTSAFPVNLSLSRNPGYRAEKFAVASVVAGTPNLFVVAADSPARTLRDLVEIGRRRPINFGTGGVGTTAHLSTENLLRRVAQADVQHIPFAGAGPAMVSLLGGQIDMVSTALPAAAAMVQSGRARGLAVTSATRNAAVPEVPTVAEAGFDPIVDLAWVGVLFPAAVPPAVMNRVNADVTRALAQPGFQARLAQSGFEPIGGTPAESQDYVTREIAHWRDVVRALNVQID